MVALFGAFDAAFSIHHSIYPWLLCTEGCGVCIPFDFEEGPRLSNAHHKDSFLRPDEKWTEGIAKRVVVRRGRTTGRNKERRNMPENECANKQENP